MDALDKLMLATAAERAEDVYNAGTFTLDTKRAQVVKKELRGSPFMWRFDVMIPVLPDRLDQRVSEWYAKLYRKDVYAKVELRKGKVEDDPMLTVRSLVLFWTTLFVAFDGQIFHEPERDMFKNVGQVPPDIPM